MHRRPAARTPARGRGSAPSPGRAPAGSACRRRAASSASPPQSRRYRGWPRTATCRGRPRRGREGRRGTCSPPAPAARSSRGFFRAGGAQIRLDFRACLAHQVSRLARASASASSSTSEERRRSAISRRRSAIWSVELIARNGTDRGPAHPVRSRWRAEDAVHEARGVRAAVTLASETASSIATSSGMSSRWRSSNRATRRMLFSRAADAVEVPAASERRDLGVELLAMGFDALHQLAAERRGVVEGLVGRPAGLHLPPDRALRLRRGAGRSDA